jgi:hypothetical protein
MEKKELNCACGSCEDCETCSLEKETKEESSDEDATDKPKLPVAARDYTNEIDAYMSYLCNGAFGKLYKKDAAPDDEVFSPTGSSMREHMWVIFSTVVGLHLREYAVPQYGDAPTDQLYSWTPDQCIKQIGKYVARMDSNARGEQENLTDLLKIAHYASVAWLKLRGYEDLFSVKLPDESTTDLPLEGEIVNIEE